MGLAAYEAGAWWSPPIIAVPPPSNPCAGRTPLLCQFRSERPRLWLEGEEPLRWGLGRSWWPGSAPEQVRPTPLVTDPIPPLALANAARPSLPPRSQPCAKGFAAAILPGHLSACCEVVLEQTARSAPLLSTPAPAMSGHRRDGC